MIYGDWILLISYLSVIITGFCTGRFCKKSMRRTGNKNNVLMFVLPTSFFTRLFFSAISSCAYFLLYGYSDRITFIECLAMGFIFLTYYGFSVCFGFYSKHPIKTIKKEIEEIGKILLDALKNTLTTSK